MRRQTIVRFAAALLAALVFSSGKAMAGQTIKPGAYQAQDWGVLEIVENQDGALAFSIFAVGDNRHTCDLEGIITNGKATLTDPPNETICTIRFTPTGKGVTIDSEACQPLFCGQRASFDGMYKTAISGCAPKQVRATWNEYKNLYDRGNYAKAVATLKPVLKTCEATLDKLAQIGPIRNDLAAAYHKMGDNAACRAILEPYRWHAEHSDDEIMEYPKNSSEDREYRAIAAAARLNLAQCGKPE